MKGLPCGISYRKDKYVFGPKWPIGGKPKTNSPTQREPPWLAWYISDAKAGNLSLAPAGKISCGMQAVQISPDRVESRTSWGGGRTSLPQKAAIDRGRIELGIVERAPWEEEENSPDPGRTGEGYLDMVIYGGGVGAISTYALPLFPRKSVGISFIERNAHVVIIRRFLRGIL